MTNRPPPELYQDDALDRRRAGVQPVWQILVKWSLQMIAGVTLLFAAICGWFGVRWLSIEHLRGTGVELLLVAGTCLAAALGSWWGSRVLYRR